MKRFLSVLIILILFFSNGIVKAEGNDPIVPAAYIENETLEPMADRTTYVSNVYREIYSCPVRKKHVLVTLKSSEGPTIVKVRIFVFNAGYNSYLFYEEDIVELGRSCSFDLEEAAKYKIVVVKQSGVDGNCSFRITATA